MKSNVDLTENRMFSTNSSNVSIEIEDIFSTRFPWDLRNIMNEVNCEYDLDYQHDSVIALGSKEERAEVKKYRDMDARIYCERCGKKINKFPWDLEIGLCHKCNDIVNRQIFNNGSDKCPWRFHVDYRRPEIL